MAGGCSNAKTRVVQWRRADDCRGKWKVCDSWATRCLRGPREMVCCREGLSVERHSDDPAHQVLRGAPPRRTWRGADWLVRVRRFHVIFGDVVCARVLAGLMELSRQRTFHSLITAWAMMPTAGPTTGSGRRFVLAFELFVLAFNFLLGAGVGPNWAPVHWERAVCQLGCGLEKWRHRWVCRFVAGKQGGQYAAFY